MILADALHFIESHDASFQKPVFDVVFVTYDKTRKKGGEIISLKGVRKVGSQFNQKINQMINVQAPGNTSHPIGIHIRLILEINNKPIIW